jgi:hypothetical protein
VGERFLEISDRHKKFIQKQKVFFVATATEDSYINISPKGMDCFRVIGPKNVIWLNATGSGNETAAHILENSRMTIMFAAFEGLPMILRLYGKAKAIHKNDEEWNSLITYFNDIPSARQIFNLSVELVQKSCGFGVPLYSYSGERTLLKDWADKQGQKGIEKYWEKKNQTSLNGSPTHIMDKNLPQ